MFHVGDLVIYSAHGVCQIDDICEKTYVGMTRNYYTLHPLEGNRLTISIPVDHESETILKILDKEEAGAIIQSFKSPGIQWIEKSNTRVQHYQEIVNTGNRQDISKIVNTLMKKKLEMELQGKKLNASDHRLLATVQRILLQELAISLDTTYESILERVNKIIQSSTKAAPSQ